MKTTELTWHKTTDKKPPSDTVVPVRVGDWITAGEWGKGNFGTVERWHIWNGEGRSNLSLTESAVLWGEWQDCIEPAASAPVATHNGPSLEGITPPPFNVSKSMTIVPGPRPYVDGECPKDGTTVLASWDSGTSWRMAHWSNLDSEWIAAGRLPIPKSPTHWMPMPTVAKEGK